MKTYEQIKAKYREGAFPIIDERTFDAAVNEILEENAYLRRLSLHALSGWAMGLSIVNALHENGTKKRQIAYFIKHRNFENMYRKEKDKWRKSK